MAWDYAKTEYEKQAAADPVWSLERQILYGLEPGEKLKCSELIRYLNKLNIPEESRAFLRLLIQ